MERTPERMPSYLKIRMEAGKPVDPRILTKARKTQEVEAVNPSTERDQKTYSSEAGLLHKILATL